MAGNAGVASASDDGPTLRLVSARQLARGEPELRVVLLATNGDSDAVDFQVPDEVAALIETSAGTHPVRLERDVPGGGDVLNLDPQTFARIVYRGLLPVYAHGFVTLQLVDLRADPVSFHVEAAPERQARVVAWGDAAREAKRSPKGELIDRILGGLTTYEPVYFVVGGDAAPVTAKFQLSAQYRALLEPLSDPQPTTFLGHANRFVHDLYLGYTQTSVWELDTPSAPFIDTTFRPGFYYYNDDIPGGEGEDRGWAWAPWDRFGLQAGFEHESNGKSGDDSRGLNTFFVRPIFSFGRESSYHFTIAPRVYAYLSKEDNRDIDDYRGYVDLQLKFGKLEGAELTATLRKGTRKAYGSARVDLTYPIALLASNFGAFLHVQYFYGYGDTLLRYDRNAGSQLRAGFMIVPFGTLLP